MKTLAQVQRSFDPMREARGLIARESGRITKSMAMTGRAVADVPGREGYWNCG